ncbi:glycosyltransferase family 2 protein [Pseudokineococcus marinus]|uniref:Glycosyltransferase family 2 protein n=1 Tax=Pseudokineococcus marinus TaxID=351215 RepID=A0A849BFQ0_9ACTN|nr:glycosyltransferase family 2 protein [Pseudokineococcus marinus]NNH21900.1 glycosyltransferase family 2 protein [Pseudokineococcus marinus]
MPGPHADVTVVMPAMNREGLIARALRSVASQTLTPARVVVVDDASDDGTADAALAEGVEVIRMPERSGSGPARNAGIEAATTTWVAFLDSDDEWLPEHLETVMAHAGGRDLVSAAAVSPAGRWLGSPSRGARRITPRTVLVPSELVVTSATVVRREALVAAGMFRPLLRAQDLDLWIRLLEKGEGVVVGDATVLYHEHAQQAVKDVDLMRRTFERIVSDYADRPWMDVLVRDGALGRVVWDDLRAAQRTRDGAAAAGCLRWFATHPAAVPAVARVLLRRARARARLRA